LKPQGLIEGSPASNALLVALLNDMLSEWPAHLPRPYVFSDNFAFVGSTRASVREAGEHLASTLASHRAGPFSLHSRNAVDARDKFELLGYELQLVGGQVCIDLSHRNHERFWSAFDQEHPEFEDNGSAWAFLKSRLAGFPALTDDRFDSLVNGAMLLHPRGAINRKSN
jgi:hypothetical protein